MAGHHHHQPPQHHPSPAHHQPPQHHHSPAHHHQPPQHHHPPAHHHHHPEPHHKHHHHLPLPQYGTFPVPILVPSNPTVPGYIVAEGSTERHYHHRLCCGIGIGWFLFIIGFLFIGIPWYVGAVILFVTRIDPREKVGYTACLIAAIVATIVILLTSI